MINTIWCFNGVYASNLTALFCFPISSTYSLLVLGPCLQSISPERTWTPSVRVVSLTFTVHTSLMIIQFPNNVILSLVMCLVCLFEEMWALTPWIHQGPNPVLWPLTHTEQGAIENCGSYWMLMLQWRDTSAMVFWPSQLSEKSFFIV